MVLELHRSYCLMLFTSIEISYTNCCSWFEIIYQLKKEIASLQLYYRTSLTLLSHAFHFNRNILY